MTQHPRWSARAAVATATALLVVLLTPAAAGASTVGAASVALSSDAAGATAVEWAVDLTTSASGALSAGSGTISLVPQGATQLPTQRGAFRIDDVTTDDPVGVADLSTIGGTAVLTVATAVPASHHVRVTVDGVTNPTASTTLGLQTSADTTLASAAVTVVAAQPVGGVARTLSSPAVDATATSWDVTFTTSSSGGLQRGNPADFDRNPSTITFTAPSGTTFPDSAGAYRVRDVTASSPLAGLRPGDYFALSTADGTFTLATPVAIPAGHQVEVVVNGVTNPAATGSLGVRTSSDTSATVPLGLVAAQPVTGPTVTLSSAARGATAAAWDVLFTTSSSGGLQRGNTDNFDLDPSTITLTAPSGTTFPESAGAYRVRDVTASSPLAGLRPGDYFALSAADGTFTLATPVAIPAGHQVEVVVNGVTNPAATGSLGVRTSSDTSATVALGLVGAQAVTSPTVTMSSTAEGATLTSWDVLFTASSSGGLQRGNTDNFDLDPSTITLTAPAGTAFTTNPSAYRVRDVTADGPLTAGRPGDDFALSTADGTATLATPIAIPAGHQVEVVVFGVTNPAATGSLTVRTSSDTGASTALSLVAAHAVASPTVALSSPAKDATATAWSVGFTTSATGALQRGDAANFDLGASTVTLAGPTGTVFPDDVNVYRLRDVTAGGALTGIHGGAYGALSVTGSSATFTVPFAIPAGHQVQVEVDGVTNPPASGSLSVSTSSDTVGTAALALVAAQASTGATVVISSPAAGAPLTTWSTTFTTSSTGGLQQGNVDAFHRNPSLVTITGPAGTVFPTAHSQYALADVTAGGGLLTISNDETVTTGPATATIGVPIDVPAGHQVRVVVYGVTNPTTAGSLGVDTTSDTPASAALPAAPAQPVFSPTVALSDGAVGTDGVTYTIEATTSSVGGLSSGNPMAFGAGASTVTITAGAGTILPTGANHYVFTDVTAGGASVAACGGCGALQVAGTTATVEVPFDIPAGHAIRIVVDGVTNGTTVGTSSLVVSTSADTAALASYELGNASLLAGTVRLAPDGGGGPVVGAAVQICATEGSACILKRTDSAGAWTSRVPDGSYTVTASSHDLTVATVHRGPVVVDGAPVTGVDLELPGLPPLPAAITVGGQTGRPSVLWSEPAAVAVTACPVGAGVIRAVGGDTITGASTVRLAPLHESPLASGHYTGTLPPLFPVHGGVSIQSLIACMPNTALFPNAGPPAGGQHVSIVGTHFTGATRVQFGGADAAAFTVRSDKIIDAVSPPGTGVVDVVVTKPSGSTATGQIVHYTYTAVTSGTAGADADHVVLHGTGFTGTAVVMFGPDASPSFTVDSDTQITATVAAGAGDVDVSVWRPGMIPPGAGVRYHRPGGFTAAAATVVAPQSAAPVDAPSAHAADDDLPPVAQAIVDAAGQIADDATNGGVGIIGQFGNSIGPMAAAAALNQVTCYLSSLGSGVASACGGGKSDPSGTVVDTAGNPVTGATATLYRADTAAGPFVVAPADSALIDPALNPETTGADGTFHWDVVAASTRSRPRSPAATPPATPVTDGRHRVLPVPPPRVGLLITLDCGAPRRLRRRSPPSAPPPDRRPAWS